MLVSVRIDCAARDDSPAQPADGGTDRSSGCQCERLQRGEWLARRARLPTGAAQRYWGRPAVLVVDMMLVFDTPSGQDTGRPSHCVATSIGAVSKQNA